MNRAHVVPSWLAFVAGVASDVLDVGVQVLGVGGPGSFVRTFWRPSRSLKCGDLVGEEMIDELQRGEMAVCCGAQVRRQRRRGRLEA